jgi:hypothetical protein
MTVETAEKEEGQNQNDPEPLTYGLNYFIPGKSAFGLICSIPKEGAFLASGYT